ncbi:triphosphoribosyl-dephospho-CoA synthase [Chondromyces apiculatus]|uniref:triphosphoribosyl-dephospho-CoA synthase n=1 Tax=Chondromyces apiculatus TaxID=51 RepID=UPI0009DE4753|nr:triphosphoribosyl-dephospho-CoA synthase [Chondromyces apiculatus]
MLPASRHLLPACPTARARARRLGALATAVLIAEAELTPKPALVDRRGRGAHTDLDLDLMRRSARALQSGFEAMALCAAGQRPSPQLRERLAQLGRDAEVAMLAASAGANTHRGAIWALGLLLAGAVASPEVPPSSLPRLAVGDTAAHLAAVTADTIAHTAGAIARHPDRLAPPNPSHGAAVCARYGVSGARGEACAGFPHVLHHGLPTLRAARARGLPEDSARLDALLAIMSHLDDTCLLHRGGRDALLTAQVGASTVLALGGTSTPAGSRALHRLDAQLLALDASPGGSADLLAATLFLDALHP